MFTGELISRIMFVLHWWFNRATYQNATRNRWDRLTTELVRQRNRPPHWWNAPTLANPQIGRAGRLTPAQTWRANGGRWVHEQADTRRSQRELLPAVLDAIRLLTPPVPEPQARI